MGENEVEEEVEEEGEEEVGEEVEEELVCDRTTPRLHLALPCLSEERSAHKTPQTGCPRERRVFCLDWYGKGVCVCVGGGVVRGHGAVRPVSVQCWLPPWPRWGW